MTEREQSRRTFLKATAATGAVAAVGDAASQETQTIELQAKIGGWGGVSPPAIEGEINPTLDLQPGRTYRVVWTNVDGIDHNFAVLNADGDEVVRSEVMSEQGATQTVEFEATEEMAEYFCEVHPRTMRGDVSIAEPRQRRDVPKGDSVGLKKVAEGLNAPLDFETSPDGRRFVVDQTGQIYELTQDGLADEPFLDVSDRLVDLGIPKLHGYDERGLLGLTFHPNFEENGRFFIRYSAPLRDEVVPAGAAPVETDRISGEAVTGGPSQASDTATETATATATEGGGGKTGGPTGEYDHTDVLAEFQVADDGTADPDSERALWQLPSPQDNHNGGAVAFGPDGYLYTTLGDGGAADDVGLGHVDDWYDANGGGNGQNTTESLFGGIHRIDVDSEGDGRPYGIPDDNPFVDGEDGFPEYYAWGFRNPFRMSIDADGRVFAGDAGQNRFEEVSLVEKGGNYGWNVKEGTHCFSTENPTAPPEEVGDCPANMPQDARGGEELLDPIIEYPHRHFTTAFIDGSVVIGGYVYEGDAVDALQDTYVFGNWSGGGVVNPDGQIFVASPDLERQPSTETPTETTTGTPTETGTETQTPTSTPTDTGTPTGTPTGSASFKLGGETSAWQGQSPSAIEGMSNPSLSLKAGQSYEVTWENVDGAPHNFAILDAQGSTLISSEVIDERGATQTVSFKATGNMSEYLCEVHPSTMRGSIEISGGGDGSSQIQGSQQDDGLWGIRELVIDGPEGGGLNRYVYGFGRDQDGELYLLTNMDFRPEGETGEVFRIVAAGEGEKIPTPEPTENDHEDR